MSSVEKIYYAQWQCLGVVISLLTHLQPAPNIHSVACSPVIALTLFSPSPSLSIYWPAPQLPNQPCSIYSSPSPLISCQTVKYASVLAFLSGKLWLIHRLMTLSLPVSTNFLVLTLAYFWTSLNKNDAFRFNLVVFLSHYNFHTVSKDAHCFLQKHSSHFQWPL